MRKGRAAEIKEAIDRSTEDAVTRGLCTRCRLRPIRVGKRTCEQCITDQSMRRQLHKETYRNMAIALYGGKCECCGETTEEFLTLEHRNGWGKQHRARIGVANVVEDAVKLNDPSLFGILCMNCNFATRYGGACPHTLTEEETNKRAEKAKRDRAVMDLYQRVIQ